MEHIVINDKKYGTGTYIIKCNKRYAKNLKEIIEKSYPVWADKIVGQARATILNNIADLIKYTNAITGDAEAEFFSNTSILTLS